MSQVYSPKDVARAIGVSESSLKRWVDKGLIRASKTAGGHRRLTLDSVLEYLRGAGRVIEDPSVLNLPEGCGSSHISVEDSKKMFLSAVMSGDELAASRTVMDAYISGASIAEICDAVITASFHEVGNLWECGEAQVYEERRACEICSRVVHELRRAVGTGTQQGPLAMGGTLDGDPYTLATSLIEIVLRSIGWNASSLGNMLPFESVRTAILTERPVLFWVSVTSIRDADRFIADFNLLFDVAESVGTSLVVGGQALNADIRQRLRYTNFSDNFQHLESFARTIKPGISSQTFQHSAVSAGTTVS